MMFALMPAWGMSNAAATLVGQNLGAGHPDRAEKSVWLTGKYNAWFMGLVSLGYLIWAPDILMLFSSTPEVVGNGSLCLRIVAAGYIFYAFGMVITQAFNGAGDTRTPTRINFVAFWMFQLPLAFFTSQVLDAGPLGVFIAITLAEVLLTLLAVRAFRKGRWKTVSV
jgi:Na+-driven multidrug efflux pump